MTSTSSATFWQNAYQNHAPRVFGLCRRYVSDRNTAEDLMHDTFITAINKQNSYEKKGSFEGWLSRIAVNTVLMYLRKQKKWAIDSIENIDIEENNQNSDVYVDDEYHDPKSLILASDFQQEELLLAIDALPLHHKTVFNLYVFENFSHQQIAENLQISAGTSKSHLARARKKIQETLVQRALEKKKKNRRVAAFMPLTALKSEFIDDLYKSKLNDLQLPPKRMPDALQKMLKDAPPPIPSVPAKFIFSKTLFSIVGVSVILGVGAILFLNKKTADNQPISAIVNSPADTSTTLDTATINQNLLPTADVADQISTPLQDAQTRVSTAKNKKQDSAHWKATPKGAPQKIEPETIEKQTVIVKKQVIKKDTIFQ